MPTKPPRSLRIVTYNILLGASARSESVGDVLERLDADIIALQEVTNPELAEDLAAQMGMELTIGRPSDDSDFNLALLTRFPIAAVRNRRHPGRMLRSHLDCQIEVPGALAPTIRVHCVHLPARFGERNKGEMRRSRELTTVLAGVDRPPHRPHIILGDFNALSPGDRVEATRFFRRMAQLRSAGLLRAQGGFVGPRSPDAAGESANDAAWRAVGIDPRLEVGIPRLPAVVTTLGKLPHSERLDRMMGDRVERWTIERMLERGYVDCYRADHPRAHGYTCASWLPAARIDYIFASDEMAARLTSCDVVGGRGWHDAAAVTASDHFPLVADFSLGTKKGRPAV